MATRLHQFNDYRELIKDLCKEQGHSFKAVALETGIHTSYFSRVMVDKADFNQEQLFLIGQTLGLHGWELDFLLLLGEWSRSGNASHKSFLKTKIKAIQDEKNKVIGELDQVYEGLTFEDKILYYREALTAKIHMYLTIDRYRKNKALISKKLFISENKLNSELNKLESLGLIEQKKTKIIMKQFSVHLEENDPLSPDNHINWRLESISQLKRRESKPTDYHMSAVFSTDEEGKGRIKNLFKEFVVSAQKEAVKMKSNAEVFSISFDLY